MDSVARIDYRAVVAALWAQRRIYYKVLPVAFVLACIIIVPQPRYYTCQVMLAPEGGSEVSAGSLTALASSFGFNLGEGGNDAIYPMLYPDLFSSPEFVVSLMDIHIHAEDADGGVIDTDYYTYLTKHQKKNWLTQPFKDALRAVKGWISTKKPGEGYAGDVSRLDPFNMSTEDYTLVTSMDKIIRCSVDKKTDVITIDVTDQNRLVCALLADSIKSRLQVFITGYRTSKARLDLAYYEQLASNAKAEYRDAVREFDDYCDAHQRISLQSHLSRRDELEKAVGLKYETYTAMVAQLEAAKAKVQERTPAFTTLKSASAPVKPAGPKRMVFVFAMLVLATFGCTAYALRRILI